MNNKMFITLFIICFVLSIYASVKPHFQLTGNKREAIEAKNVKVLMAFPDDESRYDIIGEMGDCSSFSEYAEFIAVFKKTAAKYGANCIVVSKSFGTNTTAFSSGLCVDASAIYLKPKKKTEQSSQSDCVDELKEIIELQKMVDSLKTELRKCKGE